MDDPGTGFAAARRPSAAPAEKSVDERAAVMTRNMRERELLLGRAAACAEQKAADRND